MEWIDKYRDKARLLALLEAISAGAKKLRAPFHIMEVCGGHTHTIMRNGFAQILPKEIVLVHGPGCPVCIMPRARIDHASLLAQQDDVILLTLGDMIRVPGSFGSLGDARVRGADVRFVYSPLEALRVAKENPHKLVIFFAIGFETTTPMSAALLAQIHALKLHNVLLHINHVSVPEPLFALLESPQSRIDALLAPSHVSVIMGARLYEPLCEKFRIPIVVAGFEPVDILESILLLLAQKLENTARVDNQYARCVSERGNLKAQEMIQSAFVKRDFEWRGLGIIPRSAYALREEYRAFDAEARFASLLAQSVGKDNKACLCGEILRGAKKPTDCPLFGKHCVPTNPVGSCMVSDEGACAAYYKYGFVEA
ncbi:MAG: hydrogenase formation protein HypD [Helicobacter sp.]|nr:hydrogenase formation protein HypD [Helicobacter sp.]